MSPGKIMARSKTSRRSSGPFTSLLRRLVGLVLLVALGWFGWVYWQIATVAHQDQAAADQRRTADAIAVFGAAEYAGHPSPVLHARLDHALELYQHSVAPVIITLGGGRDLTLPPGTPNSEGEVGFDYLLARGVPANALIAETLSSDTEQSVLRLQQIAAEHHFVTLVVVSDATHLFRIRELCRDAGLTVYTSPRLQMGHISGFDEFMRIAHEALSYTAWRLHLH
jgi:uncharacterized SAM-binding protein YcdF (DUF218 family)